MWKTCVQCMTPHHLKNREVWAHGTSLSSPLFIEVSLTGQKNVQSCICVSDVMYLCVRGINFASFYDFDILFWNCSDSVVFFRILSTVSRECGIFRILPTVSRECGIFVSVFHFIT